MSGHGEGSGGEGSRGTRMPQNVKPKPNQPAQNRKEDFIWKEKPQKVRRSKSSDSERADRGRRRERDRHHGERRPRGRSEETRRRDGKEGDQRQQKPVDVVEDTECAVCFCSYDNIFKTPKLLACGHTFCLECLARINVTSPEIKTLCCPVCRVLTELPHGRDLPRLGNNQEIIGKLPAEMQKALSVRFKRSKGKLELKHPPAHSKTNVLALPKKKPDPQPPAGGGGGNLSAVEEGVSPATTVDVGRPPSRVRGRIRRLFHSDQCYYVVVASIITITVALMLVGILAFVIIPNVTIYHGPGGPGNSTGHSSSESQENSDP
ncbi:E3 ubiquitin-protein ligase RNF183 [Fundulus diaphanus]